MWMHGNLSFRTETFFQPGRHDAQTPAGSQPLVYVARQEQSWSNGMLAREKFTFKNPINEQKEITLSVSLPDSILMLKNVVSMLTQFVGGKPADTVFELKHPAKVRFDANGIRQEIADVVRVRQFISHDATCFAFANSLGAENVVPIRGDKARG